ncbi:hypothetical protein FB446DRAFT_720517 [Lentinula raphanica]|nr:hypothetical protein FB446DRAFT_720517 [Lentinula raphanica]
MRSFIQVLIPLTPLLLCAASSMSAQGLPIGPLSLENFEDSPNTDIGVQGISVTLPFESADMSLHRALSATANRLRLLNSAGRSEYQFILYSLHATQNLDSRWLELLLLNRLIQTYRSDERREIQGMHTPSRTRTSSEPRIAVDQDIKNWEVFHLDPRGGSPCFANDHVTPQYASYDPPKGFTAEQIMNFAGAKEVFSSASEAEELIKLRDKYGTLQGKVES